MTITVRVTPSPAASAIALAVALATVAISPVEAQSPQRGAGYGYAPQYVVAESEWGNGVVRGAVRPGRHGLQVRLPRGTWIDCARSCSDTLRRQTVDFWESNGPNAPGSGRGYFKWDFRF
jgi:hypothetical protein